MDNKFSLGILDVYINFIKLVDEKVDSHTPIFPNILEHFPVSQIPVFELKLITINKIQNSVPQPCQPHFKCFMAIYGYHIGQYRPKMTKDLWLVSLLSSAFHIYLLLRYSAC